MNIRKISAKGNEIALINSDVVCISDVQSALDFMMYIHHETGSRSIVINKEALIEEFFNLSTKIAGEILQKFINYNFRLAIWGNFLVYTSKPLKDFIYESNQGKDIFFVTNEEEAMDKLSKV